MQADSSSKVENTSVELWEKIRARGTILKILSVAEALGKWVTPAMNTEHYSQRYQGQLQTNNTCDIFSNGITWQRLKRAPFTKIEYIVTS